jgi:hypothetical protein
VSQQREQAATHGECVREERVWQRRELSEGSGEEQLNTHSTGSQPYSPRLHPMYPRTATVLHDPQSIPPRGGGSVPPAPLRLSLVYSELARACICVERCV